MEQVGFLGVGAMGGAIVARLIQNGVPVLAYDPNAEVLERARSRGAATAESVLDVVNRVEVVFACLPNAQICRQVALGPAGVVEGSKVRIYADTSTIGGSTSVEIAEASRGAVSCFSTHR